jgi:hypothetical protein
MSSGIERRPARQISRYPGYERNHVIEQPDLRLVEEGPEIPHHRGRQHHRQQDDGGPEAVALELLVDQPGQAEADNHLQEHGPAQEVRRDLQGVPDVAVAEHAAVVVEPDELDRLVQPVGPVVGERQPNGPQQRKYVDRQQEHDGRRDEQPGDGAVR